MRGWLLSILLSALMAIALLVGPSAFANNMCRSLFAPVATPLASFLSQFPAAERFDVAIKPLRTGAEGLAAKIALIDRAKSSIDVSYYIFKRDDAGYAMLEALKRAVERGVRVRVLVDGVGAFHPTQSHLQALLNHSRSLPSGGVMGSLDVKVINPVFSVQRTLGKIWDVLTRGKWGFAPLDANNRSHDKILLVDSGTDASWAVLGGRNVGDHYYGLSGSEKEIVDYEVVVKGGRSERSADPLEAVNRHFEILFHHSLNLALTGRIWGILSGSTHAYIGRMNDARASVENFRAIRDQLEIMRSERYWQEGFETTRAALVSEIQNVVKVYRERLDFASWYAVSKNVNITYSAFEVMRRAKKSVSLISPYVLLSKNDIAILADWLERNPNATFSIYTNSFKSTNQPLVTALFNKSVLPELQALSRKPGVGDRLKIYLYQGGSLLHAKTLIIDDSTTLVTTSNLEPRSRIYNSEVGLWSDSELNHQALSELRDKIEANSEQVDMFNGTPKEAKTASERLRLQVFTYLARVLELVGAHTLL